MSLQNITGGGGFSRSRLERLNEKIEDYVARGEVAGVSARLFRHNELAYSYTTGWQDVKNQIALQPDSIFRIMSMTKPVIAAAALILLEEGVIRLDEPVDKLLPELANRQVLIDPKGPVDGPTKPSPRPISLRDLLTFRPGIGFMSGLIPYDVATQDLIPAPLSYARQAVGAPNRTLDLTPDEWMAAIGRLPLAYAPGVRWLYNVSSDILGVLVARASGQALSDFLNQRLFQPLGMKDTGFVVPAQERHRLGVGYGTKQVTAETVVVDEAGDASFHSKPPVFASAAAGLVSTADDYLRFGRMLLNGGKYADTRILSRKTVDLMTANHLTRRQAYQAFVESGMWGERGFGFGVSVISNQTQVGPSAGTYTWGGAYGTNWLNDPQEDLVLVMMIQQLNSPTKLKEDFVTLAYQAIDD